MEQLQLPFAFDIERTAPAPVVRSALFGIVKRGTRRYVEREVVASWGNDSIIYTGKQLDQGDFDLWLEALHQSQGKLGKPIYFSTRGMLQALRRSTGGKDVKWLERGLTRLNATEVKIISGGKEYGGSFLHEYEKDTATGEYYLTINEKIGRLFDPTYAKMLLDTRHSLKTDLSRWLYAFISSQKSRRLHTIGVQKLQTLSGSTSTIREFRRKLKRDLPTLEREKIIDHWYIRDNDVLEYRRKPNPKIVG
jgi:hypothetical protein